MVLRAFPRSRGFMWLRIRRLLGVARLSKYFAVPLRFTRHPSCLAVHFAAVSHAVNTDYANSIGNLVNHAIVADAYSQIAFSSDQLSTASGTWIPRQCLNCGNYSIMHLC